MALYLSLLAGRFSLDRLGDGLPDFDLRWGALGLCGLGYAWWRTQHMTYGRRVTASPVAGFTWFVGWSGWLAVSALWAPPGSRASDAVVDLVLLVAFAALTVATARRLPTGSLDVVWTCLVVTGALYLVGALVAGPGAQGRYAAFGGGPNVFVRVMILAVLACFYLAIVKKRRLLLVAVPPLIVGSLLAGSRGGLVALLAVALLFGRRLWRQLGRGLRHTLVFLAVLALGAVAASGLRLSFDGVVYQRIVDQTLEQGYDSGRTEILAGAVDLFTRFPVAGAGLDGYYGLVGQFAGYQYPHNLVIATLAESGLVGGLLFLGALTVPFWTTVRAGLTATRVFYLAAATLIGVASLFSGDYYDTRFLWFFLFLGAIEASSGRRAAADPQPGRTRRVDDRRRLAARGA
ncbi:O-antigen ligase family protein [Terracoccus luteus]|uniref:O-antigen ligase family protein n=1 Tax=Terracoccus luteus TaxID=53356 RepID=UPI0011C459C6|nr:O-antigen ligase family protein [Terracoccus luteus]